MTAIRTHTVIDSPIGALTLVAAGDDLCGLYMAEHRHKPDESTFGDRSSAVFGEVESQLTEYFEGDRTEFSVPLRPWYRVPEAGVGHLANDPVRRNLDLHGARANFG